MINHHIFPRLAILLCLFSVSCTKAAQDSTITSLPSSPSAASTETPTPRQPAASPFTESTSTPFPTLNSTFTIAPSPSPAPIDLALWKDDQNGFGIQYPASWKLGQPAHSGIVRYEGEGGYFELIGIFQGSAMDADRDCTLEFFQNPGMRYGKEPVKSYIWVGGNIGSQVSTCMVESKDQSEQFAQMHYVSVDNHYWYAVIETSGDRAGDVYFIILPTAATPTLTPPPLSTSAPNRPTQTRINNFNVNEWIIVPPTTAYDYMFFLGNTGDHPLALPTSQPTWNSVDRVTEVNADLAPYHDRIEAICQKDCTNPTYRLLHGSGVLKDDLAGFGAFSQLADKTNFVLGLWDSQTQGWLITKDGVEPYDLSQHQYRFPIYAGQHLITLNETWDIVVESDGQPVFRWPTSTFMASPEVAEWFTFDGHWVLEIQGVLIVDGQIWNLTRFPAEEIFEANIIAGKLFFFFRRDNQISIYYDGKTFPTDYTLIHHYGCCGYEGNNPHTIRQGIAFYAIKNGMWNYVEITKN